MRESKPDITFTKTKENNSVEIRNYSHIMDMPVETTSILDNDQTRTSSLKSLFNSKANSLSANSGLKGLDILEREPQ